MKKSAFFLALLILPLISTFPAQRKYVSPSGNDSGKGEFQKPFKTIGYALKQMKDYDTLILREGIYREEITINKTGITLRPYKDETVLITGCDPVTVKGEPYIIPQNNETCTRYRFDQEIFQLFADGKRMEIARWPDKTASMLSLKDWEKSFVDAAGEQKIVNIPAIAGRTKDFWKGGYYIGLNSAREPDFFQTTWYSGGGRISSSEGDTLHLTNTSYGFGGRQANDHGYGYILKCIGVLDAEKEWLWEDGYLYFKHPSGKSPGDIHIEARTRLYALNIHSDHVTITGLHFKAGAVLVTGNHVDIHKCTFRYISPFVHNEGDNSQESGARCNWGDYTNGSSGICVLGNGFSMRDCYVAHSWFNGVVLWGDNCIIENCVIEDVNWIAKRCAGINTYGAGNIIRYNTIRNTGATSIEGGNASWIRKYAIRNIWEHNLCENATKLVVDQAFFYVNHQSKDNPVANSEWRYNILKGAQGPDRGRWMKVAVALYPDNSASGYRIHHNVVIDALEGFRHNGEGTELYLYNNTFYNVDQIMDYNPERSKIKVFNNLSIACGGGYIRAFYNPRNFARIGSNVEFAKENSVEDARNSDFRLKDEQYIDAGELPEGIELKYAGKAPDIGAIQTGMVPWKAGANLVIPVFSDLDNLVMDMCK